MARKRKKVTRDPESGRFIAVIELKRRNRKRRWNKIKGWFNPNADKS